MMPRRKGKDGGGRLERGAGKDEGDARTGVYLLFGRAFALRKTLRY